MPPFVAFLDAVMGHAVGDPGAPVQVLAHQGGWDEILMVAGPIAIFALLLRSANRRAERMEHEGERPGEPTSDATPEDRAPRGPI